MIKDQLCLELIPNDPFLRPHRIISPLIKTAAYLSTMSGFMGTNVLYIVVPVVIVAVVAYILIKLPPPVRSFQRKPGATRRFRRTAPVSARADSWPDLELPALDEAQPSGQAPRGGTRDGSGVEAPAPVWKLTRQPRRKWSFTIPKKPALRLK